MGVYHRQALQYIKKNQWDAAHRLIQEYYDPISCRIHGYLHCLEGDLANARYWYDRAGQTLPNPPWDDEFNLLDTIVKNQDN